MKCGFFGASGLSLVGFARVRPHQEHATGHVPKDQAVFCHCQPIQDALPPVADVSGLGIQTIRSIVDRRRRREVALLFEFDGNVEQLARVAVRLELDRNPLVLLGKHGALSASAEQLADGENRL